MMAWKKQYSASVFALPGQASSSLATCEGSGTVKGERVQELKITNQANRIPKHYISSNVM